MRVTLIYDNEVSREGLEADWGFACLVEAEKTPRILFDTGASGRILLANLRRLDIDPSTIEEVFISHAHGDHTGGLADLLRANSAVTVYLPRSCVAPKGAKQVVRIDKPQPLHENVFSTGELAGIEQSMAVKTETGLVVIAGCSHPGVERILDAASRFGRVRALIGGLHGFREFDAIKDLERICACHCTQFKAEIRARYPEKWLEGGAGTVLEL